MPEQHPHPDTLRDRYKNKLRQSSVAVVVKEMKRNGVTVEDIIAYQAEHDPNAQPLERIREYKSNGNQHRKEQRETVRDSETPSTSPGSTKASTKATSAKTFLRPGAST